MLLTCLAAAPLQGQISPGPLARAHRTLEGTRQLREVPQRRPQRAVRAVRVLSPGHRLAGRAGARLSRNRGGPGPDLRQLPPRSCREPAFELVKWPEGSPERFDHRRAGWPLEQSHADAKCERLPHRAIPGRARPAHWRPGTQGGHWTGLESGCASCHEDIHRGALGADCRQCHDAGRWKVTPGLPARYHQLSADGQASAPWPATSATSPPRWPPNETPPAIPIPVYRPVPHRSCASCHRDPHAGRLGESCTGCHTTRSFQEINRDNFDHDRTRYPLKGKHATTKCAACHGDFSTVAQKKPAYATCASCHADAHNKTGTAGGTGRRLRHLPHPGRLLPGPPEPEHSMRGPPTRWRASTRRSAAPPATARRPARRRRAGATPRVVLQPASATCRSCHADDHGTQLATRPDRGECSDLSHAGGVDAQPIRCPGPRPAQAAARRPPCGGWVRGLPWAVAARPAAAGHRPRHWPRAVHLPDRRGGVCRVPPGPSQVAVCTWGCPASGGWLRRLPRRAAVPARQRRGRRRMPTTALRWRAPTAPRPCGGCHKAITATGAQPPGPAAAGGGPTAGARVHPHLRRMPQDAPRQPVRLASRSAAAASPATVPIASSRRTASTTTAMPASGSAAATSGCPAIAATPPTRPMPALPSCDTAQSPASAKAATPARRSDEKRSVRRAAAPVAGRARRSGAHPISSRRAECRLQRLSPIG